MQIQHIQLAHSSQKIAQPRWGKMKIGRISQNDFRRIKKREIETLTKEFMGSLVTTLRTSDAELTKMDVGAIVGIVNNFVEENVHKCKDEYLVAYLFCSLSDFLEKVKAATYTRLIKGSK